MASRIRGPGSKLRTVTLVEEHTGVTDIFLEMVFRSVLSTGHKPEPPEKKEPRLRDCLHQMGVPVGRFLDC